MRESQIETAFKERIKALGGKTRKVAWIGVDGAPDRLALLPGQHVLVELKRPGEKPRIRQLREHETLRAAGCVVLVIDSLELIDFYFPLRS